MKIAEIERLRAPFYNKFTSLWANLLYKQSAVYFEAIRDYASLSQLESIPYDIKPVQELFLKTWIVPGKTFAAQNFNEFKKSISTQYRTKGIEDDYFERFMADYAYNEAGTRITSIAATNRNAMLRNIRQSLLEAQTEGWGAEETARFIQANLKEQMVLISRYSAERIARTEIVGASNRGQLLGAQTLGYNMIKSWLPYIDPATRTFEKGKFNHAIEEHVGLYDNFVKTGEPMQCPGDPHGSAGNVINCRCSMTYKVL